MSLPTHRAEKFWSQVSIPADVLTGCWLWTGCTNHFGYGVMKLGGRQTKVDRAHRIAWSEVNGPIPDGASILHSCDVPACVNPAHLRPGTDADNHADMVERGRASGGSMKGTAHHQAKLTDDEVRRARAIYATGAMGTPRLAKLFGVKQQTMWRVVTGVNWRHIQ
jgi:hypothetical protein